MALVDRFARWLERLLEFLSALLVVGLTAIVVYAVCWRYLGGASPRWYDELASILLVWLTYYAGALAALKRGHIAVESVLVAFPPPLRLAAALLGEAFVIGFFAVLAWTGMVLLDIVGGMSLISLRWMPLQVTQSVIPIGAALFILAQLLSLPRHLARLRRGVSLEQEEIDHALAKAEEAMDSAGEATREARP